MLDQVKGIYLKLQKIQNLKNKKKFFLSKILKK